MTVPSDAREWRLRGDGTCAICGVAQPRGTDAWWSPSTKSVFCTPCTRGRHVIAANVGVAGASSAREFERRLEKGDATRRRAWGLLEPVAALFEGPKQSTAAWAKGARGEERLAAFLQQELDDDVVLIHDRRVPERRSNIDHIAVGPSGVWVIDAKCYTGTVTKRDVGGPFRTDIRVFVGSRDQTKLVKKLPVQVEAVRAALTSVPAFASLPVGAAICFTNSDWGILNLGKPFEIDGVLVTYPGALRETLRAPARLDADLVGRVAARLATELRPA